jgi:catechol-2,3-dioxygenase
MRLNHLHLHVRDRARSVRFYSDWFGLCTTREFDTLTFLADDAGFDLALMEDSHSADLPPWFHFGFRQDTQTALLELLEAMRGAGVPIARDLYQDETLASYRCSDPDGYTIEVYWEESQS